MVENSPNERSGTFRIVAVAASSGRLRLRPDRTAAPPLSRSDGKFRSFSLALRGNELHVERTFDQPDAGDDRNRCRATDEHQAPVKPRGAQGIRQRQECAHYGELPAFHADVETHKRDQQGPLRPAEILEDAGEPESVYQPAGEGHD